MNIASIPDHKNTLVIFGSPHKNRHTAKLLNEFLHEHNISEYVMFNCYEESPLPCNDCGWCKLQDHCVLPDLKNFYNQFEQSELVIMAFPVYNGSFPAPLKALIDRFQVYYNARFSRGIRPPIAVAKKVYILLTSGSGKDYSNLILEQLSPVFTITNCNLAGIICMASTDSGELKYYQH